MARISQQALVWGLSLLCVGVVFGKPLNRGQPPPPKPVEGDSPESQDVGTGLAYDHYLQQVVEVLESDPDFKRKLETANVSDIKSGKIAMYLEMVNHTVRTSLDELKRREIARLQELTRRQRMEGRGRGRPEIPGHIDVRNPHSFEMKDLEHLIKKTTSDLEEMDKQRRSEFKEYEMEKEYEKRKHLSELDEEKRKEEEARLEELKKKHQEHPKINHPASKDQFEEVWDKQDHLGDQEFNPRTFFFTHDINGDMELDIEEIDALLQLELDKIYEYKNSPEEDDPREREEEMARMREHVFTEMDKDKNFRITLDEFIDYTGREGDNEEFKKDEGWKTVDEEPFFDDEEYLNYVNQHHNQPGEVNPPGHPGDLQFQPEHQQQLENHIQQQQQQFQQQQLKQQQQQQGQQHQPPQQQQPHQQQPQHQQQQFQQPPPGNQPPGQPRNAPHPPAEVNPPAQVNPPMSNQQHPNAAQQHPNNVVNMQQSPEEQEKLKQQLKELQEKLNQQQKP